MPSDKLVQQLGNPDVTTTAKDGGKVIQYFEREKNGNMRTVELTFDIASNGTVASADVSAL